MKESEQENNWFKQHEKELLEEVARKRDRRIQDVAKKQGREALDKLRAEHWLKCPKCGHDMQTVTLEGIEVENCTFCHGVYFDRNEIESLLLRKTPKRFQFYRKFFGLD